MKIYQCKNKDCKKIIKENKILDNRCPYCQSKVNYVVKNPYKPAERDKYMVKEEYDKFILASDKLYPKYTLLWEICAKGGLRISEALSLTVSSFLWNENSIKVRTLKRADHPIVTLGIPKDTINRAKEYVVYYKLHKHDKLFDITRKKAWTIFKKICKVAKLNPKYSPHALRHMHGLIMAEYFDGNVAKIKDRLRHKDSSSTDFYIHISDNTRKEIVDGIEKYFSEEK